MQSVLDSEVMEGDMPKSRFTPLGTIFATSSYVLFTRTQLGLSLPDHQEGKPLLGNRGKMSMIFLKETAKLKDLAMNSRQKLRSPSLFN